MVTHTANRQHLSMALMSGFQAPRGRHSIDTDLFARRGFATNAGVVQGGAVKRAVAGEVSRIHIVRGRPAIDHAMLATSYRFHHDPKPVFPVDLLLCRHVPVAGRVERREKCIRLRARKPVRAIACNGTGPVVPL